jgi:opacity protein-like surface antigen
MRLKLNVRLALALLFVGAAYSAYAQTVPAARGPRDYSGLAVGVGFSGYNPDDGHGHLLGGTLWIDYIPNCVPHILRGLGVEAEARDLSLDRSATEAVNLRIDYAGGGLIYSWPHFRKFRPYAKGFMGFGNADQRYDPYTNHYFHDSRSVTSFGGGLDYRVFKHIWVRGDYEYQTWPTMFLYQPLTNNTIEGRLKPQGFTLGAMYHF